ncbi:unnamed protein product [Parajaminaea phylloscopi]
MAASLQAPHERINADSSAEPRVGPAAQGQDCILCRITGTVVFALVSIGAFKEAWKLAYPAESQGPEGNATEHARGHGLSDPPKGGITGFSGGWKGTLAGFVHAMEAFPTSQSASRPAVSDGAQATHQRQASPARSPNTVPGPSLPSASLRVARRPTGKIAFLLTTGTLFAAGAVYRAVMPATQPSRADADKSQD